MFTKLQTEVINQGLCTHCGTCVGLSDNHLSFKRTSRGPLPVSNTQQAPEFTPLLYSACPGKGFDYPMLNKSVFGEVPQNWLIGINRGLYISYSLDDDVRRAAASGGVITQTLIFLLDNKMIDGAVVLQQGVPKPWLASPVIATSRDEILAASQSVYSPAPVNTILGEMDRFNGRLAYVGLPDQIASLRVLQSMDHRGANKVKYVIGPYTGTNMYLDAIESFLRSNGIGELTEIEKLRYREGEWPGHLYIRTLDGEEIRAEKFYYNYLIPFYITQASLLAVDFTNELTDISVGDAWNPRLEAKGEGFSVVVSRSELGDDLLHQMANQKLIKLEPITMEDVLDMHGHMLDFKKRGAFIRNRWRSLLGLSTPEYGYFPKSIPLSRHFVEAFISFLFIICKTALSRRVVQILPIELVGPLFEFIRRIWKSISRSTKRRGLWRMEFVLMEHEGERKIQ
jgi:coenzyme F420 hydrogenase subunit beta